MAILDAFEVHIIIDGKVAEEYDDDAVETDFKAKYPKSVSKYVEAVSGVFFEFRVRIKKGYVARQEDCIDAGINVDGKDVATQPIGIRKRKGATRGKIIRDAEDTISRIRGVCGGKAVMQTMQFSNLEFREARMDNDANAIKEQYKGLGTFHIELWRSVDEGVSRMPNEGFAQSSAKDLGAVPENALKGSELDVTTCYVPDSRVKNYLWVWNSTKLDDAPIAVFRFKYRTRRALQTLSIIPTPVALEDRPVEDLSRDEMIELLRRHREQPQIKPEDRKKIIIKREREHSPKEGAPRKFSRGPRGEKVYHLDSDSED